ncbi:MAG: InlB B-repeat-containing protein [Acholeplasmataceae bacterium]|nr:InlB B-repeat-containing protein [Acholeplasmataceae bacterium]
MNKKRYLGIILLVAFMMFLGACDEISVRLTYETNGGTALPYETVTQGHIFGELPEPEKTGHTFLGWFEDEALAVPFDADEPLVRNRVIYAKWEINEYTITFETNGGATIPAVTEDYGTALDIPEDPYKDGNTFLGWFLDPEFETPFEATSMPDQDLTIYASWDPEIYEVVFVVDGNVYATRDVAHGDPVANIPTVPAVEGYDGTWDSDLTSITSDLEVEPVYVIKTYEVQIVDAWGTVYDTQVVNHGDSPVLPDEEPTKVGYQFVGYSEDFETFVVTEDLDIQVIFQVLTFTVEFFDQNGTSLLRAEVEYGSTVTAPEVDVEDGYVFDGWDASFDVVTEDLEIYAIVQPMDYDLVFNAGNGVFDNTLSTKTVTAAYLSVVGAQEEPVLDGFDFAGWYLDAELTGDAIVFGPQSTMPLGGLVLYAKWTPSIAVSGTYVFVRENLVTGLSEADGDPLPFAYESDLTSPIVSFEGYLFKSFEADGVTYEDPADIQLLPDLLDLQITYERIIVTLTFVQNPQSAGGASGIIEDEIRLYYNDTYSEALPEIVVTDPQYQAQWDRTIFVGVKDDLTVRAVYYISGVQTITFVDEGAIKYIATKTTGAPDQIVTEDALIWNLVRPGHKFLGWYTSAIGGTLLSINDMLFSNFTGSQSVYARWQVLEAFDTPTNLEVSTDLLGTVTVTFTLDPAMLEGSHPASFVVRINGTETVVPSADASFDLTSVTIIIATDHPSYEAFEGLLEPGLHTIAVKAVGDQTNHLSSPFSTTFELTVDTDIEGEVTDVAIYDYFIVEDVTIGTEQTKRYVFYTDMTYRFSDRYVFEIIEGDVATADESTILTTSEAGNFRFEMTVDGTTTTVYEGRVVENIKQFGYGQAYATYLAEKESTNYLDASVLDSYHVGTANPFVVDLRMIDNSGARVSIDDVMLVFDLYLDDDVNPLAGAERDEYVTLLDDNALMFTEFAVGHQFTVVARPRYQANMMTVSDVTFEVSVNEGYNVYSDVDLKAAFADLSVNTANILRNITAELSAHQKNSDGSPINITANAVTGVGNGNVYTRLSAATNDDSFTVNGHYLTVDGSDLPKSNADSGSGTLGYAQSFEIINVQISMFYYNVYDATMPGYNANSFEMNNLTIIGNTTTPQINYGLSAEEIASQEQLMSENSGGYNAIIVRNGTSMFDNLRVGYSLIGFTANAYGSVTDETEVPIHMTLDHVKIYDSWANSLYLHNGTGIEILRSEIGQSGGAAIHMVDARSGSGLANPEFILDNETVVNNWISGEEAWFKAYSMSVVALQLKGLIESSIAPLGRSIIRTINNPVSGLPTQMINFIMLTEPSNGAVDNSLNPTTGSEVGLRLTDEITQTSIERPYDFLSAPTDPRVSGGNFMFPVGPLSDTNAFLGMMGELMGLGFSQSQAAEAAYVAGFYNLTAMETAQVLMSGLAIPDGVAAVKGADHITPRFLEVLAQVPIFTAGYSIVVVEVGAQE